MRKSLCVVVLAVIAGLLLLPLSGGGAGAQLPIPDRDRLEQARAVATLIRLLSDENYEIRIGQRAYPNILKSMGGAWDNPAQQDRVETIGRALLAANQQRVHIPYAFTLVDSPEVNAGALMGGPIFVTRGLLAISNDQELAGVLAHEIAHIELTHGRDELADSMVKANLALEIMRKNDDDRVDYLVPRLMAALHAGYSRAHEAEADSHGVIYCARAGFSPLGLLSSLWTLCGGPLPPSRAPGQPVDKDGFSGYVYVPTSASTLVSDPGGKRKFVGLFADHPSIASRMAALKAEVRALRRYVPEAGPYFPEALPDPLGSDPGLASAAGAPRAKLHEKGINMCFPLGAIQVSGERGEPLGGFTAQAPGQPTEEEVVGLYNRDAVQRLVQKLPEGVRVTYVSAPALPPP